MQIKKYTSPLFIILSLFSFQAFAAQVSMMAPACISENSLDEAMRSFVEEDMAAFYNLVKRGKCIMLSSGQKVAVLKSGFEVSTIRVNGARLYTLSSAVR